MKFTKSNSILLAIGFCAFMIVSISETFLTDFSAIRRELFLKVNKTEKIVVSEAFWANQSDKNEVLIDGNYYDIKSTGYSNNNIILYAVPDKFDLTIKKITENLNKKHKLLKTKKSIDLLPSKAFFLVLNSNKFLHKNNFSDISFLTNKIVIPFFHPPSFI